MNRLKQGDRIYGIHYNSIGSTYVIDRVTEKFAFSGATKFRIEYADTIDITPRPQWHNVTYYIETEKLKNRLLIQNAKSLIRSFKYDELPDDVILKLYKIIKPYKQ